MDENKLKVRIGEGRVREQEGKRNGGKGRG